MTELIVRRVIVACDAACDVRPAVEEAAALAVRWHAALHGIFFEDENLFRLAALPFRRQVSLSTLGTSEALSSADLEMLSLALGNAMRQALAEISTRLGLAWSFGRVRDLPSLSALATVEGDLLVVEGAVRPFSGSWRPRSAWDQLADQPARPILLRRRGLTSAGMVLVFLGNGTDWERMLEAAFAMAGVGEKLVILVAQNAEINIDAVSHLATRLAVPRNHKFQLKAASAGSGAVLQSIKDFNPALIVMDSHGVEGMTMQGLLAATRCDVLLMR